MKRLLMIAIAAASLAAPAAAADMPLKAPLFNPLAAAAPLDMVAGWSGFYGGVDVYATGTGVNLADLGALTAGGNAIGATVGWETYNGMYLFGARAGGSYDMMTPGLASFSDHAGWHAGVVIGANLYQALGINFTSSGVTGVFPGILAKGIPYMAIEACGHNRQNGECTSVGMEFVIPNSRLTIHGEYVNGQYGSTNGAPGENLKTSSNGVRLGGYYHW